MKKRTLYDGNRSAVLIGVSLFMAVLLLTLAGCGSKRPFHERYEDAVPYASVYHVQTDSVITLGMSTEEVRDLLGEPYEEYSDSHENIKMTYLYYDDGRDVRMEENTPTYFRFLKNQLIEMNIKGPDFETIDGYRTGMLLSDLDESWTIEREDNGFSYASRYIDRDGNPADDAIVLYQYFNGFHEEIVNIAINTW